MKNFSLIYALLLMGFTAIVGQVLLIRELMVTFSGNELSIGIFFANWLILEALGSYLAGRWADRIKTGIPYYVILQFVISVTIPLIVFLIRIIKNLLGIIPGQGVNILTILYSSCILLIPLGLADGAQFSFGCRIFSDRAKKEATSIGTVYVYEAIGSILGGIAGTYICIQYLNAFQTAFALAGLNILSAILLLFSKNNNRKGEILSKYKIVKFLTVLITILYLLLFYLNSSEFFHKTSIIAQWRGYEIVDYQNSIYGNVALLKRAKQLTLMANGVPSSTIPTPDIAFIEDFVHFPLLFHPFPQRILLVGGGIGGIIENILKHPIHKIDHTELDPLLIKTIQYHAPSLTERELDHPSVEIHFVDGRYFIRTTKRKYDVIMINLPDPSTLEINRFYTKEFYQMCKKRLKENGILVFLSPGSLTYMSQEMINLNASLIETIKHVFKFLRIIPGDYNILIASSDESIKTITPDILYQRMSNLSLQTQLLSDFHIHFKLDSMRLKWFENEISRAEKLPINSDFHPIALYYDLDFWNSIHSPKFAAFFKKLKFFRLSHLIIVTVIVFVLLFYFQQYRYRWRKLFIVSPIVSTGFAGMGVDILIVLVFQSFYGYIYHWIGLLITSFMVGLTLGGLWMTRSLKKINDHYFFFLKLEILISLYLILLMGILFLLYKLQAHAFMLSVNQYVLLILNALCGYLVGAQFPLANKIHLENKHKFTKTAGILYAADLIGAWTGSLFVTIAFIPLLGVMNTCLLILIIKLFSMLSFKFVRFKNR